MLIPRVAQIIEAPEVIALLPTVPTLQNFSESLWKCDYKAFFKALGASSLLQALTSALR